MTDIVADPVHHRLDLTVADMGDHQAKNIGNPIRAYRIGIEQSRPAEQIFHSERPAIAVMPFDNLASDPVQKYNSDSKLEDIITAPSRANWLQVTARNSTFSYKGPKESIRPFQRASEINPTNP